MSFDDGKRGIVMNDDVRVLVGPGSLAPVQEKFKAAQPGKFVYHPCKRCEVDFQVFVVRGEGGGGACICVEWLFPDSVGDGVILNALASFAQAIQSASGGSLGDYIFMPGAKRRESHGTDGDMIAIVLKPDRLHSFCMSVYDAMRRVGWISPEQQGAAAS